MSHEAFLRAITANPEDDVLRLVYADWLEEQGDPRAEFLRLDCALAGKAERIMETAATKARWQELRENFDPSWLIRIARPPLENCQFRFRCPKKWASLQVTDHEEVRFCDNCRENVYYCTSISEAKGHARLGHCVAVDPGLSRIPGDLEEGEFETVETIGLIDYQVDLPVRELRPAPPARPKKRWWKFW
jgi:uncharacterized protein (TIGR02996 family)